jgi:hypothetical protein
MNFVAKLLLFATAILSGSAATAGQLVLNSGVEQVTLLELYTSQGCSSCPPAERWLNSYVDSDELWTKTVPLAFHVDYWDYLGWKDSLADSAHGERQRDYARAGRTRTVYTPGMFANGREWRGWTFRLKPRASERQPGNLSVTLSEQELSVTFRRTDKPLALHVSLLGFGIETAIERGENRNRTLRQEFVVLAHDVHDPESNGQWIVSLPQIPPDTASRYALAVWISESGNPAPLQATGGWLDLPLPHIPQQPR